MPKRSNKQNLLNGKSFFSSDPELIQDKQKAHVFMREFNNNFVNLYNAEDELRNILGSVGINIKVVPPIYLSYGYKIFLRDNVHINLGVFLGDAGRIDIGNNVLIGPYVQIYTTNHKSDPSRRGYIDSADVSIGDDVWIGGGVIILPGVTIGNNSIVGAGSVVKKDIPSNSVAVGNPAKIIKEI